MSIAPARLRALQMAGATALLLACGGAFLHTVYFSETVPFIRRAGGAAWIGAPIPFTTNLIAVRPEAPPVFTFVKRFSVEAEVGAALLSARGLRQTAITLNARAIDGVQTPRSWRRSIEVDVTDQIRIGRNELRVEASNVNGPPLIQLRLEMDGRVVETDSSWQVIAPGANPKQAVLASDRMVYPGARMLPEPGQILRERPLLLVLLFAGSAGAYLALISALGAEQRRRLPAITLGIVSAFWLMLFVLKLIHMPVMVGFDVPAHLVYIESIINRHTLPLAGEGFSNYHPPAFHLLTALLVALFDVTRESAGGQIVFRLVSFAAGLCSVWLTWLAARALWPEDPLKTSLAVASAGLMPMNVYISSYVSNESLHATFVSLCLLLGLRLLLAGGIDPKRLLGLSGALGLALLTKFTSLMIAPVIAFFVAARVWLIDERGPGRGLAALATLLGGATAIAGWFYLRNWIVYGDPVVWNLNVPGEATWWMQPGFHTSAYYTHFGESLRHPFFAGFDSFWDGVYSTFWGDGLAAGMIRVETRHMLWNYDLMTLCYWLALPASALMAVGFVRMVRDAFRDPDPGRRLALCMLTSVLFLLSFSLFMISFRLPFYAQVKAFYVLSCVLPLSLVAAEGLAWIPERLADSRHRKLRALYFGWLGTLGGVIAGSFLL